MLGGLKTTLRILLEQSFFSKICVQKRTNKKPAVSVEELTAGVEG
jgi:hypothetical protein